MKAAAYHGEFSIDAEFPGGNVAVVGVDEVRGEVSLKPDNRGGEWFYTHFRVCGAAGRTLRFLYEPGAERLSKVGPAVSSDGGATWRFLNAEKADAASDAFTYCFASDENEVFFATGIPYVESNWRRFIGGLGDNPRISESVLCKSQSGRRDNELLRISGDNDAAAPYVLLFTCRHHACEMSASRVMEGVIEGALAATPESAWAKKNTVAYFVPFMDKDGVEEGEQGKARKPTDYNQDYLQGRFNAVRAVRDLIGREAAGRKFVFLDLHAPWIRENEHDHFYFLLPQNHAQDAFCEQFRDYFGELQSGALLRYDPRWDIPGGAPWNNAADYDKKGLMMSQVWMGRQENCLCGMCCEVGYGLAGGVYTEAGARELGRNIYRAVIRCLKF